MTSNDEGMGAMRAEGPSTACRGEEGVRAMKPDRCLSIHVTAVLLLLVLHACGGDQDVPSPTPFRLPAAHKIEVPDSLTTEPAVAVPAGISADGQVVVGTIFVYRNPEFVPVTGFRWTLAGGMTLFAAPGRLVSVAQSVSRDGSVVVGTAFDSTIEDADAWVWNVETGFQILPAPAQALSLMAQDVSADGEVVLGSIVRDDGEGDVWLDVFVWSEGGGVVPLNQGFLQAQVLPVGISDNGLRVAYNCTDMEEGACYVQGTFTLQSSSRAWSSDSFSVSFPPIAQSENRFVASTLLTTEFGIFSAHSSDLAEIGGGVLRDTHGVTDLLHPAIWLATDGQLNMLTGLGMVGNTTSISPDGTLAAYDRHLAVGTPYAFVWSSRSGSSDLQLLFEHADATLGSDPLDTFPAGGGTGMAGYVTGFSGNNERAAGVMINVSDPNPDQMFGFLIDNFQLLLP